MVSISNGVSFQVAGLFRDASIGNPINIVVVRLILLEKEEVKTRFCMLMKCVLIVSICVNPTYFISLCLLNVTVPTVKKGKSLCRLK